MLNKYKILVVDDEIISDPSRKSVYDRLLSDDSFDVNYIKKERELTKIEDMPADGYIIDVNLQGWKSVGSFDRIIPRVKGKGPVFLVSSRWLEYDYKELMQLLNATVENPVKSFFALNELFDRAGGTKPMKEAFITIQMKILTDLNAYYRRSPFMPRPDEALNMLHISDLQFGDPSIDPTSFLSEKAIGQFLRNIKKIQLHFLIVTGDIAYSGKPSEYDGALEWFKSLLKQLWPDRPDSVADRILLVPGNHDVNFRFCAADHYKFNFGTKRLEEVTKESADKEHCRFGLAPFAEFAYTLTKDQEWLKYENKLSWVNEKFLNIGLRFYHLNSVSEVDSQNANSVKIEEPILHKILKEDDLDKRTVFNIALSHHGMKIDKTEGYENWDKISNFNKLGNIRLFIHGHGHKWSALPDPSDNPAAPNMYMIMSPSTHIKDNPQPRGFNLITLTRDDEKIRKVISQPHPMNGTTIEDRAEFKLEWKLKGR